MHELHTMKDESKLFASSDMLTFNSDQTVASMAQSNMLFEQ